MDKNIASQNQAQKELGPLIQTADGSWSLIHSELGEAYHSLDGALKESRDLFIKGSGLDQVLSTGSKRDFRILEYGLGLGYNALSTLDAFRDHHTKERSRRLHLLSFESDSNMLEDFLSAKASFQQQWPERWLECVSSLTYAEQCEKWQLLTEQIHWEIYPVAVGSPKFFDILKDIRCDYIWHDPFSISHNPELWTKAFFQKLRECCAPEAVLMTYSVSGVVRRNLAASDFEIQKIPTTTRKKEWLKAIVQDL